jgi:hypothetical protein
MFSFRFSPAWRNGTFAGLVVFAALVAAPADAGEGVRRALLVGCTEFPEMKKLYGEEGYAGIRLTASQNDVELLRNVLVEKHGFDAQNIVSLAGWDEAAEETRPTRRNIERAFKRMAVNVQPGDVVVVFLASHCTQLPLPPAGDESDPTRKNVPASVRTAERDKYDEIFMAADAGGLDWEKRKLPNGIFDHELASWIQDIRLRGALVCAIVNTPHAAGLLDVAPEMLLKEPSRDDTPKGQGQFENLVALYACHADEHEPSMAVQLDPPGGEKPHGLFTWMLCEGLRKDGASERSYRELLSAVLDAYRQRGSTPVPAGEGELDRATLVGGAAK